MRGATPADFAALLGKTLSDVTIGEERVDFTAADGSRYCLYYQGDCREDVTVKVEDVIGDPADLIGSPILMAEEATSGENPPDVARADQMSFTWTFYKLATIKGYVTIRWYGESNGYYSEAVDFVALAGGREP
jgi:hypothetical protein